jgi:hypothetical protein
MTTCSYTREMEPLNAYGKPLRYFTADNNLCTTQMFLETASTEDDGWSQFTLKSYPVTTPKGTTYPSLHETYVESNDLSEYEFANTYFYNYSHWCLIKEMPFFQKFYQVMRSELEAKLSSKALHGMVSMIDSGTASQSTLKYMADRDYIPKTAPNTLKAQPTHSATLHAIHGDDLDRISS